MHNGENTENMAVIIMSSHLELLTAEVFQLNFVTVVVCIGEESVRLYARTACAAV